MEDNYMKNCIEIYTNGGILWLIERTDTNEFLYKEIKIWQSNKLESRLDTFNWNRDISFMHIFFLNKEDAENELKYLFIDKNIPFAITEHLFINKLNH